MHSDAEHACQVPMSDSATPGPSDVLTFWFGDGLDLGWPSASRSDLWFGGGPKLDRQITAQFGPAVHNAVAGGLQTWEDVPATRLALIILLDQFTRNVYRGSKQAYAGDVRAHALVKDALAMATDQQLPWAGRAFMYMPLMHTEAISHQDECVRRFTQLHADVPDALKASIQGHLTSAHEHRDIVARFGRFPYRNAVLGRTSTALEQEFLTHGPRFGQ